MIMMHDAFFSVSPETPGFYFRFSWVLRLSRSRSRSPKLFSGVRLLLLLRSLDRLRLLSRDWLRLDFTREQGSTFFHNSEKNRRFEQKIAEQFLIFSKWFLLAGMGDRNVSSPEHVKMFPAIFWLQNTHFQIHIHSFLGKMIPPCLERGLSCHRVCPWSDFWILLGCSSSMPKLSN